MTLAKCIWELLPMDKFFQAPGATTTWGNHKGTLLYKGSVDNPDGTVQGGRSGWPGLGNTLSPHSLYPVQHKYQHTNHRDGSCNAGPDGKIKWSKEREDADFLLRSLDQDPHWIVHVPLAEVHNALPLWGNGDGGDGQVCSLKSKTISSDGSPQLVAGVHLGSRPALCPLGCSGSEEMHPRLDTLWPWI